MNLSLVFDTMGVIWGIVLSSLADFRQIGGGIELQITNLLTFLDSLHNYFHFVQKNFYSSLPYPCSHSRQVLIVAIHSIYIFRYISDTCYSLTFFHTNFSSKNLHIAEKCSNFALATPRDGAVVARWAHNPKVRGSSPLPATQ